MVNCHFVIKFLDSQFISLFFRQLLGTEEESSDHATSDEEEIMMENFPTGLPNTSTAAANLLFCR